MADLTSSNVEDLLGGVDLILDGTDNFETRYLINDFAVERGRSLGLWRGGGQLRDRNARGARARPRVCGACIPIRLRARSRRARRPVCWER